MILEIVTSLIAVAGFGLALSWSRIVPVARQALKATLAALSAMTDSELDDAAKELAIRHAGIGLIVASFSILWRLSMALAAAGAPILLADAIDLASREAVLTLMLRLDYIVAVTAGVWVLSKIPWRKNPVDSKTATENNPYSFADRFFHVIAFSSPAVLKTASWIEDRLVSEPAQEPPAPPIFVTSLARGGTTALLNALNDIPGVSTSTYRDMPFLTAPTLWNRLAGGQKRTVERHERAHGDGLEIDLDSPEAFEEVIWKMFWPEKYRGTSIALWSAEDRKPDAEQFLNKQMAKVIHARLAQGHGEAVSTQCYCSKNNANIARIRFLVEAFPKCRIIVPVRRPECHAASLLRQHLNFSKLHAEDDFTRRYMHDIGHFEFGQIHKPFGFPGFSTEDYDAATDDYWLYYWIHAFREILEYSDRCIFVLQDDLRSSPQATMTKLCSTLNLAHGPIRFASYFRSSPDRSRTDLYDRLLFEEAGQIYSELQKSLLDNSPS